MIYNEYAQVLEAKDPATGKLYKPDTLNVINYNEVGTAMLQDGDLRPQGVARPGRQRGRRDEVPAGLVPGLDLLRDQPGQVRGPRPRGRHQLGKGHQAWQMNEVTAARLPVRQRHRA